jgi:hypothetical protein
MESKRVTPLRGWLSPEEAGAYLSLSPRTLENMRGRGEGPKYSKLAHRVRYHVDDLDAWVRAGENGRERASHSS